MSQNIKVTKDELSFKENFETTLEICLAKKNKELKDKTWKEIVDELELNIHPDTLARTAGNYRDFNRYLQILKKMDIEDNNYFEDLLNKISKREIKVKKQEMLLQDLRSEINKQTKEQARFEQMYETAKYVADKLQEIKPYYQYEVFLPDENEIVKEGVLLFSDLHFGQETENYWNNYNPDIFYKRVNFLTQRVIDIAKTHDIRKLHVMGLGDYINGLIHTTTRLSNREDIGNQVVKVCDAIADMIYEIASKLPHCYVTFSMTDDNHSRLFANKKENTDKDTFVFFMKRIIHDRIKEIANAVFLENKIDSGITVLNVCNKTIVGVHGDKDSLKTALPDMTAMLDRKIDYMCIAHYHSAQESEPFGESELIVNGCFGGTDDYAKNLRKHSKPIQKFMIFSKEYGRECTYNIDVRGVKN